MRVVVTGATGNVGTALLRRLDPGVEVVAVARRLPAAGPPYDRAEWKRIDIGVPGAEEPLAEAVRGADAVVHLAWLIQPSRDEATTHRVNVLGSERVFAAAVRAGVRHLVHMSSVGAYTRADKDRRVDELWPVGGIPSSCYSRQKSAVERLLDGVERDHPDLVVSRPRPSLILQPDAASEVKRYFLGPLVPTALLRLAAARGLPVLPLPRGLVLQFTHADDVADAVARVLDTRLPGAVNIASEPVIGPRDLAALVGARHVPVPETALRAVAAATWRLHAQPTSPGWIDLALGAPILSAERARAELGWTPASDAREVVRQLVEGMARRDGVRRSPPLHPG
ncbi:NAD-dependent epimerase/dehydratase family protein [Umezawaea sp.]|uniref:NAD-dependent epimerase/dehydratase family protein n=1 Tax=Umezawaea sp. TaxID=1955258 RepID=UPI002ED24946